MNTYETPQMELIYFETIDIMCLSVNDQAQFDDNINLNDLLKPIGEP